MKLSEKGMDKFYDASILCTAEYDAWLDYDEIRQIKFEPEDFEGMVALTVEEAKTLIDFFITMKSEMPNGGCMEYCDLWRDFLQKRIKNSEN